MSQQNPIPRTKRGPIVLIASPGQTHFSFPFWLKEAEDIEVRRRSASDPKFGAPLLYGPDFDIAGLGEAGGATVILPPQNGGTRIRLIGKRLATRTTSVVRGGSVNSVALETELDLITATDQELRRDVDDIVDEEAGLASRLLRVRAGETIRELPSDRAGLYLAFDDEREPIVLRAPAVNVTSGEVEFASRFAAIGAVIPDGQRFFRTAGYLAPGDGGAGLYEVVDTEPGYSGTGKVALAGGKWGALGALRPSLFQFGLPDRAGGASAVSVFEAAVAYAVAKGIREVDVPAGKYNLTGASYNIHRVLWRGDGELIGYRTPIARPGQISTFSMPPGIIPELHFKRLLATDRPVVVFMGDSLTGEDVVSPLNLDDALVSKIKRWLLAAFPEKKFTFHYRGIGGARWADMNDVWPGPTWPDWYTDHSRKWIEYLRDLNVDLAFLSSGMNDGALWNIGNFVPSAALSVLDSLRGFQKEPDIILCTNILPSKATDWDQFNTEYAQEGRDAIAGWVRSVAQVSNYYGLPDFNRWVNVARDGRDILDCSFDEDTAIVATQTIPFVAGVKAKDFILRAQFTSIASNFWSVAGNPIEIRLSDMPGNLAFLDAPGGYLRLRIYSGFGALSYQSQPTVEAPPTGSNVTITYSLQGSSFYLKVGDSVLYDDVIVSYGGRFTPFFGYANNPTGMVGTFTLLPGREKAYPPQVLDKEIYLPDDAPIVGANPWNHPTGYGSDVVYAPLLSLNARGAVLSPETRALTDLRAADGVLFDFVTRTYAMRSRTTLAKNKTGPVADLVLDTAGGSLSYAAHSATGENIGLSIAAGGQGAHILLSSIPFSATEGTMMVEGYAVADADDGFLATIARNTNWDPRIDFVARQDNYAQFSITDDNSGLALSGALQCQCIGRFARLVLGWKDHDFDMSANGWRYLKGGSLGVLPTGLQRIKLGHASGTVEASVVIRRLFVSPYKLGIGEMMSRGF